jgi:hypothetical protein
MRFLASPRRRRRAILAAAVVVVAVPLVYLGVHFSNPGSAENANGPVVNEDIYYKQPKHVPFTATKRRAVRKMLSRFVSTAVARHHVIESWDLAGPALREGLTRRQWATGAIPVTPYPVAKHGQGAWSGVQYSYRNKVGLEVLLFPKPGSGYSMATVSADVVRGHDGQWRINNWMLTKFHGPGATAPADSASALSEGPPNVHTLPGKKEPPPKSGSKKNSDR